MSPSHYKRRCGLRPADPNTLREHRSRGTCLPIFFLICQGKSLGDSGWVLTLLAYRFLGSRWACWDFSGWSTFGIGSYHGSQISLSPWIALLVKLGCYKTSSLLSLLVSPLFFIHASESVTYQPPLGYVLELYIHLFFFFFWWILFKCSV